MVVLSRHNPPFTLPYPGKGSCCLPPSQVIVHCAAHPTCPSNGVGPNGRCLDPPLSPTLPISQSGNMYPRQDRTHPCTVCKSTHLPFLSLES
eukprot:765488-Hanusia_phi.AAC.2